MKRTEKLQTNKIHYCWFGKGPKPEIFDKCLKSWKLYMPNYEIIEWNEQNTDLSFSLFAQKAYADKAWAFVSDVVRLKVIYEHGGIYMDTDVELLESIDCLMENDAFFFFQNSCEINTGLGFGARKGNLLIKKMLDMYSGITFDKNNLLQISCPSINTIAIEQNISEFVANGKTQHIQDCLFINSKKYWSIAIHYGEFSWATKEQKKILHFANRNHKETRLKTLLRNPKIYEYFDRKKLRKIKGIYTFCVYDLVEYGVMYWIIKCWYKLLEKSKGKIRK